MKTKFAKELAKCIKEDLRELKRCPLDLPGEKFYSYDRAMNEDSTEQTYCGLLMMEKIIVEQGLSDLIRDVRKKGNQYYNSNKTEFSKNVSSRYTHRERIDKMGTTSPNKFLTELEPLTNDENTLWEQGYLAGLHDAFNHIEFLLRMDQEALFKYVNY